MGTGVAEQLGPRQFCSECGRDFPTEDLARFGTVTICSECKPSYVQRMREGAPSVVNPTFRYGGFWIRFVAVLIDGIIIDIVLGILIGIAFAAGIFHFTPGANWQIGVMYLVIIGMALAYEVYFLTTKGATPGKMALGLKVVTANGGPISAGRAVGRVFGRFLSGFILYIGFIMAGFDEQKRALHDRICDTRVIRA